MESNSSGDADTSTIAAAGASPIEVAHSQAPLTLVPAANPTTTVVVVVAAATAAAASPKVERPINLLLEDWKSVHGKLVQAVLLAREAVAAKKLQRRYWMEEICANITNEGKMAATSVWNKPKQPKRTAGIKKKKPAASKKTSTSKESPNPKRIRLSVPKKPKAMVAKAQEEEPDDMTEDEEESDDDTAMRAAAAKRSSFYDGDGDDDLQEGLTDEGFFSTYSAPENTANEEDTPDD